MSKFWEQKAGRRAVSRPVLRHLIVCEDEKSAADYFQAFRVPKKFAEVVVEGGAGNTASVVEVALRLRVKAAEAGTPYAEVWCVFDRDSFPAKNFNRAFDLARGEDKHDVHIVWSNECFELWYLLHFEFITTGIGRDALYEKLSEPARLGKKYDKADKGVFLLLEPRIEVAKQHARRLLDDYNGKLNPERDNPSTNVHELVAVLQKLGELGG